jgi:serine/threonine protein phosphatase 1
MMTSKLRSFFSELFTGKNSREHLTHIDRPTYAIGDIHGRFDLFELMLERLALRHENARLILLGDYVDRGPDSKRVLERVRELTHEPKPLWSEVVVLRGNHEATLLDFLSDSSAGPVWAEYGGLTTLASYGVQGPLIRSDATAWKKAQTEFCKALPEHHLSLLRQTQLLYQAGDYVFVHAGVRPGEPLEMQGEEVLLWIRGEFLASPRANEKVVVHGHTQQEKAELLPWRIGLDTGAYATGTLSAIFLSGVSRELIQVRLP